MWTRPIRKETVAARWRAHLVRVAAETAGTGDTFDDGISFANDITLRLAVRHRVAPLLHRALEEARMADRPIRSFWAAWIEGVVPRSAAFAPVALKAGL